MPTFYINGNNTTGVYPYDDPSNGAPNFNTLLSKISHISSDGDTIQIVGGAEVDDSSADIELMYAYNIIGEGTSSPVKIKNDGYGFVINMANTILDNISIKKADFTNQTMVNVNSSTDVTIRNCTFSFDAATGNGSVINITNSNGFKIISNTINVPQGSPFSYGLYITTSNNGYIYSNTIDMNYNNGQAITITNGSYNEIYKNIIGDFDENTTDNSAIIINNTSNYNKIEYNVIGIAGQNSYGVVLNPNNDGFKHTTILNNVIAVRENDFGCGGILIPYNSSNTVAYYEIMNNIISFRPKEVGEGSYNDSVAINASIQNGIIDYNDIYGFDDNNVFVNNGAPDVIKKLGSKTIYVDPKTNWSENPNAFASTDIFRYYCTTKSECIGAGYLNRNIGVGVYGLSAQDNNYITFLDTVTSGASVLNNSDEAYITFFNNLIMESADTYNKAFRSSNGPYVSENVYRNQWDYSLNKTFPFDKNDHFYRKSFYYVMENKSGLAPFDNIKCPANPGYGFSAYPGYETGLWGYPRIEYINNCNADPCIIQDSYTETIVIKDNILPVVVTIQDSINPPCANEKGVTENVLVTITLSTGTNFEVVDTVGNGNITNLMIDEQLVKDGYDAGAEMTNAQAITLSENLRTIADNTFNGYGRGVNIKIFDNISMYSNLIIPKDITYIGPQAFYYWDKMTKGVTFQMVTPPASTGYGLGTSFHFWGSGPVEVTVPHNADLSVWKNALDTTIATGTGFSDTPSVKSINGVLWNNIT